MRARYLTVAALALALGGCDDLLTETPEAILTPENFYRTAGDANAAVLSAYVPLLERDAFRSRLWVVPEAASDIAEIGPLTVGAANRQVGALSWSAESSYPTVPWKHLYHSISRANLAIERVPQIDMNPQRRDQFVAEARFIRALDYFYLVRLYGAVPLVTSPSDPIFDLERTPVDQVYQQIIEDAEAAAATLPLSWGPDDEGRPTRGSALMLLADVYLTRQDWQRAADYLKQVMDLGIYSLYPDYLQAFLPAYENGPEHIFSLQADGPTGPGSGFAALYYPREIRNQGGGFGQIVPTDWQYNSYFTGDYRHDVTYKTVWFRTTDGKRFDLDPHVIKYRPTQITQINAGDVNWPIYRYAETLLMYAEVLNEMGRTAEAVRYLNMIRARARNGTGSENRSDPPDYTGPMTQNAVREAIFQERNWELAHEAKRWYDLKRRGQDYFMSQIAAHDPQATDLEPTDMLLPIPQSEIDINPSLTQNPGY